MKLNLFHKCKNCLCDGCKLCQKECNGCTDNCLDNKATNRQSMPTNKPITKCDRYVPC